MRRSGLMTAAGALVFRDSDSFDLRTPPALMCDVRYERQLEHAGYWPIRRVNYDELVVGVAVDRHERRFVRRGERRCVVLASRTQGIVRQQSNDCGQILQGGSPESESRGRHDFAPAMMIPIPSRQKPTPTQSVSVGRTESTTHSQTSATLM